VYNSVIDAFARCGFMDGVSELVAAMQADGVAPDTITHSTIVKGYCVKGNLEQAVEVFRDMQKNHMVKDSIVYNTLLDGCVRHGNYALADSLLDEMDKAGIHASNFTLGILVKMYGKRRQLDRAFEAIDRACRVPGFVPNAQVRTCLLCSCLNNNALDKALAVYQDLQQSSTTVDARAVSSIVQGCIRQGALAKACEVLEQAYSCKQGRPADLGREPLAKLVQALQHRGLAEDMAIPMLDRLRSAGVSEASRLHTQVIGGVIAAETRGQGVGNGMLSRATCRSSR